ncbi:sialate O-acetylesterase [Hyunsoonleella flava]|uniref:sialate O-acetylesterase n=1 Tax=Hyunsoonleella flava TaxID=2527939 RepID=UPI0013EEF0C8|nr:sialate O-acetylesterase [Hyunsoonleella flava]
MSIQGQIELPAFFGDYMVLQQNEEVSIWGKDIPGTTIEIRSSWGTTAKTTTNSKGFWSTTIKTAKASFQPQSLSITGSNTKELNDILLGEVWFCSGQSNMEMPLKGLRKSKVLNASNYLEIANNKNIRLFNNARTASVSPSFDVNGKWQESNKESAFSFSAIGYIFGTKLYQNLNVPIGIIESSWGGTRIESWIPKEKLLKYKNIKFFDNLPKEQNKQKKPSFLYNAMVYPFQNFNIKGVLWYQGESNRSEPEPYYNYMNDLITSWRSQWKNKNLPFYFVQIAPYDYTKHRTSPGIKANMIREAQLKIAQDIKNAEIVVTTDAGDCEDIHPSKKEIIAKRLSNIALSEQYGFKDIIYRSPEFKNISIANDQVTLKFKFHKNDFFIQNNNISGFAIVSSDRVFYPAEARLSKDKKSIILYSDNVKKPVAVRYGFEDCFENTLNTNSGLPISVFRTDNW